MQVIRFLKVETKRLKFKLKISIPFSKFCSKTFKNNFRKSFNKSKKLKLKNQIFSTDQLFKKVKTGVAIWKKQKSLLPTNLSPQN